jgi:hypothetical protein
VVLKAFGRAPTAPILVLGTPLNDGQSWVAPTHPGEIMCDVYLTRGPGNRFHMVWTWNWRGNSLGYASSP